MARSARSVFVCAIVCAVLPCLPASAAEDNDEAAIRAIVEQWNKAYRQGPDAADLVLGTLSDSACVTAVPTRPTARIVTKANFAEALREELKDAGKLEHRTERITVTGTAAAEIWVLVRKVGQGQRESPRQMSLYAKEKAGWRAVCSLPAQAVIALFQPDQAQDVPAGDPAALAEARAAAEKFAALSNAAMAAPKGQGRLEPGDLCDAGFAGLLPTWPHATVLDKAAMQKARTEWLVERPFRAGRETVLAAAAPHDTVAYVLSQWDEMPPAGTPFRQLVVHGLARQADGWKRVLSIPAYHVQRALLDTPETAAVRKAADEFVGLFRLDQPTPTSRLDDMLDRGFLQIGSDSRVYTGKAANLDLYTRGLAGLRGAFAQFFSWYEIDAIELLGDAACVSGRIQMTGTTKDNVPFRRTVLETLVFRKAGDTWKLVHEHSSLPKMDMGDAPARRD
ncbi:MAG: hypothetical protein BWX88_03773 [Planctomycetes bacterium ADurb.Bin126]|nr:MAG: hypothetical protein BWX88_03773 [Planctomycetes bacterium ADurb.Bin126]HQL75196.1 nuclear transport factor 2 family protein [Phycisphaerae bacterium]